MHFSGDQEVKKKIAAVQTFGLSNSCRKRKRRNAMQPDEDIFELEEREEKAASSVGVTIDQHLSLSQLSK